MAASIKTLKFISATVYEIKRGNQYSKKEKYPYSEDIPILKMSIRNKYPRDYRLIDVMGKTLEIQVNKSLSKKQMQSTLK